MNRFRDQRISQLALEKGKVRLVMLGKKIDPDTEDAPNYNDPAAQGIDAGEIGGGRRKTGKIVLSNHEPATCAGEKGTHYETVCPGEPSMNWHDAATALGRAAIGTARVCGFIFGGVIIPLTDSEREANAKSRVCGQCSGRGTVLRGPEAGRGPLCPRCLGSGYEQVS